MESKIAPASIITKVSLACSMVLALTQGCGSTDQAPRETPSVSATPAVAGTATPSADWVIAPGKVGPITVGMDAGEAKLAGFVVASPNENCGWRWLEADELADQDIGLDFRAGLDADDLDQISLDPPADETDESAVVRQMKTAEGVGIGTTIKKMRRIYGNKLVRDEFAVEGAPLIGYTLFGPGGAVTFGAGNTVEGESRVVDAIYVTAGTPSDYGPFLGC